MLIFLLVLAVGWLAALYASKCRELSEARYSSTRGRDSWKRCIRASCTREGRPRVGWPSRSQPFRIFFGRSQG